MFIALQVRIVPVTHSVSRDVDGKLSLCEKLEEITLLLGHLHSLFHRTIGMHRGRGHCEIVRL